MTTPITPEAVAAAIAGFHYRFSTEKELQEGIQHALDERGIAHDREVHLGPGDIVDFMVAGIAVEVKTKGSLAALTRQLHRYAQQEAVVSLMLVTSLNRLGNLPSTMNGKRILVVPIGGAFA